MPVVLLYLVAVVAANLVIAALGPPAVIPVAFVMIGATLTLRDRLHDAWRGRGLGRKMALLILGGAALSWLINRDAGRVALASFTAFVAAEATDALVYHLLRTRPWLQRANGSNLLSAAVDSLIFPTLAFGAFLWPVVLGQWAAKAVGGAGWALILRRPAPDTRMGAP